MKEQELLALVREKMADRPKIVRMFERCYRNTMETTGVFQEEGVFMVAGDIPGMWLRDSTNQLRPYLMVASESAKIRELIEGVLHKQLLCILKDPYANAFNECANGHGHQEDDTQMGPEIWERKYEIDSLCSPLQLAYLYWKNTGMTAHFDALFEKVLETVVSLWETEQDHMHHSPYFFRRANCPPHDTIPGDGKGNPVAVTGMTWSGFRPSDDGCVYGYLIPSNLFAVTVLRYATEILGAFYDNAALLRRVETLRSAIEDGVKRYGVVDDGKGGKMYAYETDGNGNYTFMDDANVPSLLALPYMGYCRSDDPLYLSTRRWVLSEQNPYYFAGKYATGVGSPHTPRGYIWHIALSIEGMTTDDPAEWDRLLTYFETTDAGTELMHEGFDKDDPAQFTRPWFPWSNAMFAEFVLRCCGYTIRTV